MKQTLNTTLDTLTAIDHMDAMHAPDQSRMAHGASNAALGTVSTGTGATSIQGALKIVFFVLIMVVAMLGFIASINKALAVTLKAESIVTADHITVGDVFDGITHNADYVLAPAPRPGSELVWNARTLNRIALAFGLPWKPDNQMTQLRIQRLANVVEAQAVKAALKSAFTDQDSGMSNRHYDIALTGEIANGIVLPYDVNPTIAIERLNFDPSRKSFTAQIKAPAEGVAVKTMTVQGMIYDMQNVPVLKNRLRRGDVISRSDIEFITLRSDTLAHDVLTDEEDLIGTTPRTSLNPATPVRSFDLQMPKIVKRGETVTMIYDNNRIRLETTGKALQDGSKGDIIRILNASSNRTIEAEIINDRQAIIR